MIDEERCEEKRTQARSQCRIAGAFDCDAATARGGPSHEAASPKPPYDNEITTQQVAFWLDEMTKQKLLSQRFDLASLIAP